MKQHSFARTAAFVVMLALLMQLVCPIYALAEEADLETVVESESIPTEQTDYSDSEATDEIANSDAEAAEEFDAVDSMDFEELDNITDIDIFEQNAFTGTLQLGDSGDQVREIQRRLSELGYFTGSIGGNYGNQTAEAVKLFQIRMNLLPNGVVDEATYAWLFWEDAPFADSLPGNSENAPSDVVTSTPEPVITPAPQPENIPDFTVVLKSGSTGSAVKAAQQRLIQLRYLNDTADGAYGSKTVAAVKLFQIAIGAAVDGTINFETHIRLYSNDAPVNGSTPSHTESPSAQPTQTDVIVTLPPIATATPSVEVTPTPAVTATPTAPTNTVAPFPGEMRKGSSGANVRAVQERLKQLGYLNDKADGAYGNNTANAVSAFQAKSGLEATGVVNEATYYLLMSSFALAPGDSTAAPTATPDPDENEDEIPDYPGILKYGMSGDAVKMLQQRLMTLGYYSGSVYGNFGDITRDAVKAFQKAVELTADGVVGRMTHERMYAADAPHKGDSDHSDYGDLMSGDSGEDVSNLQRRLKELGYYNEEITGYYDARTIAAVMAFQSINEIDCNGVASNAMQTLLYSDDAKAQNGNTVTATPAPTEYPKLAYGSTGSAVTKLQERLKDLGYFEGNTGVTFGNKTQAAVQEFQSKAGLEANGIADNATQQLLFSENAPAKDDPMVSEEPTATPKPTYSTLKKGSTGQEVTDLQTRMKSLGYDVSVIGTYDDDTVAAVKLFQKASGLSVDGAAGTATQTRLYASDALTADEAEEIAGGSTDGPESNTPVKVSGTAPKPEITNIVSMDWFKNNGSGQFFARSGGTFSVGDTAIVSDVKTGVSYRVRRYGGSNHADVEPLTAFDAYQMYKLYNYNWSWARRAVVVTVGGKNIAASINGYPHGSDSIYTNNFVGHSCIHFTNSRTHGTNRVDPDHQNAIKTALNTSVSALNRLIQAQ